MRSLRASASCLPLLALALLCGCEAKDEAPRTSDSPPPVQSEAEETAPTESESLAITTDKTNRPDDAVMLERDRQIAMNSGINETFGAVADGKKTASTGDSGRSTGILASKSGGGMKLGGVGLGGGGVAGTLSSGEGSVGNGGVGLGLHGAVGYGSGASQGYGRGAGELGERIARATPRIRTGKATVRGALPRYQEPPSTNDFVDYGTNQFVDPAKDRLSTFAADVDTGSYTIARRSIKAGQLPPASSVRVEEFVNYFGYGYAAPKSGAFSVDLEAAPSPFSAEPDTYLVRVGVQGKRVNKSSRKPVHLTFLVDVSGSMRAPDKLGMAKESLKLLTNNLQPEDTVALATYAGRVAEILKPTSVQHKGKILSAIDDLMAGGSTAMNDGLGLAYKLATANFQSGHVNRVIVLSDGDANVGPASHEQILGTIKSYVDEGVTLSTIGFGMGNYKDTMMEQLANKGNGNYYYIDTMKEARKVFGEQVNGTLQVIAKDVKLQVDFNPEAVKAYRLIGYENRDIADKDFRNDRVDAGEIGAGHTVTALYEVKLHAAKPSKIATVRVRHKKPDADVATESEFHLTSRELRASVGKASNDFQFAAAVAGFAELVRKSPYAEKLSYDLILEVAQASIAGRADRKEFVSLVKQAKKAART